MYTVPSLQQRSRPAMRALALAAVLALAACTSASDDDADGPPAGSDDYDDLVALFQEWRAFQRAAVVDGVPDYTPEAMDRQRRELSAYMERLDAIDPGGWPVERRIDHRLVRAEMNGLDFDHRVLRPWARDPAFYAVVHTGPTDVPEREGPAIEEGIELWSYDLPLAEKRLAELRSGLRAIPAILEQARGNLVVDAAELWSMAIRDKEAESRALAGLAEEAREHHPDLVSDVEAARAAVDDFRAWIEERSEGMTARSGIGVENYDWYLEHVQLVPYTWEQQVELVERELDRAWAHLKLRENQTRELPPLEMVGSAEAYSRRFRGAVADYLDFLRREAFFTVPAYADSALLEREGSYSPPDEPRHFFSQIGYRDLHLMRAHDTHWIDLARMEREPHPSPIRRVPLLHNLWVDRAEGLATAMEEMTMRAGLLDDRPRSQELVYILLAQRAARALAGLRMHANEIDLEAAADFAVRWTPRDYLSKDRGLVWGEQQLYLRQPGYGESYVMGKLHIERLMRERAEQLGDDFTLRRFMDELFASGLIPVSMIRWEMTGLDDEVRALR